MDGHDARIARKTAMKHWLMAGLATVGLWGLAAPGLAQDADGHRDRGGWQQRGNGGGGHGDSARGGWQARGGGESRPAWSGNRDGENRPAWSGTGDSPRPQWRGGDREGWRGRDRGAAPGAPSPVSANPAISPPVNGGAAPLPPAAVPDRGDRPDWRNRTDGDRWRGGDRPDWRNRGDRPGWVDNRGGWDRDRDGRVDNDRWRDRDRRDGDRDRDRDRRWSDNGRGWQDNDHRWRDNDWARRSADWRWRDQRRWDRDWRRDSRYDWQRYRTYNRGYYRLPPYYAPYGWGYGYRRFSIGIYLDSVLFGSSYWIDDPWRYRLPAAYGSLRWVRYYDDALLVDVRDGYVVDVIHNFFW
jgi:hypothetical protein